MQYLSPVCHIPLANTDQNECFSHKVIMLTHCATPDSITHVYVGVLGEAFQFLFMLGAGLNCL